MISTRFGEPVTIVANAGTQPMPGRGRGAVSLVQVQSLKSPDWKRWRYVIHLRAGSVDELYGAVSRAPKIELSGAELAKAKLEAE